MSIKYGRKDSEMGKKISFLFGLLVGVATGWVLGIITVPSEQQMQERAAESRPIELQSHTMDGPADVALVDAIEDGDLDSAE